MKLGDQLRLADEGGRVWKYWVQKYHGQLVATVWEWERDGDALVRVMFGGWSWSEKAPCKRATQNAIDAFIAWTLPMARAAVQGRRDALAYVEKLPEPSPYVASNYPGGVK